MFNSDVKLFLVDGNSIVSRAYYGIPSLHASDGTPTNAVYGFVQSLMHHMPLDATHVCVVFDGGNDLRKGIYPRYKANRPDKPTDLKIQYIIIQEVLKAMNIKWVQVPGMEADDVVGTIATKASKNGIETYIITGDKDYLQLLDDNISVLLIRSIKGNQVSTLFTPKQFHEEYGFDSSLIVDLKALCGDTSDNFPGVPGIGEKTAVKLIKEIGCLDSILRSVEAGEVKGAAGTKISSNIELARTCYDLATIRRDITIPDLTLGDMARKKMSIGEELKLKELFKKLEFESLL